MRCCALFPGGRLLSETDAPYQPLRGNPFSRWADLPLVVETMAALRRQAGTECSTTHDLEEVLETNFRLAFGAETP
jgi:Tat protein secretion system quality control protein TatD with DNase activity